MIDLEEIVVCFVCDTEAFADDSDGWVEKDGYLFCPECRKRMDDQLLEDMLAQYDNEEMSVRW